MPINGLSNLEIHKTLSHFSSFLGVFPSDQNPFPLIRSYPCAFVMNTSPLHEKHGGHWLAFYMISPSHLQFFDSLGCKLTEYSQIARYFDNHIQKLDSNKTLQLQHPNSHLCGHYVIAFLSLRLALPKSSFTSIISYLRRIPQSRSILNLIRIRNKTIK